MATPKTRKRKSAPAPKAGKAFPLEIDPARVEETLLKLKREVVRWTNKGRYTRVRFKFRGKQLLPDLPLAAVVAAEGLTFYGGGILRMLLVNLAGRSVLEVELVHDAERRVQEGRDALLQGDLALALSRFREAAQMNQDSAAAQLNLGVALKLQNDPAGARAALEKAKALDPGGALGLEAAQVLSSLRRPRT